MLSLAAAALLCAAPDAGFEVFLDGEPLDGPIFRLERGAAVADVNGIWMWLDAPRRYDFRVSPADAGSELLTENGRVVGARITHLYADGQAPRLDNPLLKLDAKTKAGLRGLTVLEYSDDVARSIGALPAHPMCITARSGAGTAEQSLMAVPPWVECFVTEHLGSPTFKDFSSIAALQKARFLSLEGTLEAKWFQPMKQLEVLRLYADVRGPLKLESVRQLELTNASGIDELAGPFPKLQSLTLSYSEVKHLGLVAAPALESIEVRACPLVDLPERLPKLKRLTALGTGVTPETLARVKAEHPTADVAGRWEDVLHLAARGADRVRVRSGGLCHRRPKEEGTLAVIDEAAAVADLLGAIQIDEPSSTGICMCCGGPTVELYRGQTELAAVSFQHGRALRTPLWPADGVLVGDALVKQLAKHGVAGPLEDLREHEAKVEAKRALRERYRAALPAEVREVFDAEHASKEAFVDALNAARPDATARAKMWLALYGCMPLWNSSNRIDEVASEELAKATAAQLAKASTPAELDGLARFVFGRPGTELLTAAALQKVVPSLADRGLKSGHAVNRKKTLRALGEVKSATTTSILRRALDLGPPPTEAPESGADWVSFDGSEGDFPSDASAPAIAAVLLARRRDTASTAKIRALRFKASGADTGLLDEALKLLK